MRPMQRFKGSHLFGKVAIQLGILNRDQIKVCLDEQSRSDSSPGWGSLGEIAVAKGFIDQGQAKRIAIVQAFLEARDEDKRFGEVAVDNAFITRDQLNDALAWQKKNFKEAGKVDRIGEILVGLGYMTASERDAVLKAQKRLKSR